MDKVGDKPLIWNIDGYELLISHPQKLYWPKERYTKIDVLNYYRTISTTILPYFKDRPVTLHYFPRGIEGFSFYKRNFENESLIRTASYKEVSQDKTIQVPLIDSSSGLLWLASRGGIEFHLWSSKMPNYTHPDIAIFDLDISKDTDFNDVLKAGWYLHELLNSIKIKSYPKTSGGTGLHVYVPIVAKYSFELVRNWVKSIGNKLANCYPEIISTKKDKGATHKSDKVIIDCLQNVISRNTAAPYTVRAYSSAPISTPLSWDEVKKGGFTPKSFTIKNVPDRVAKLGDLFSEVLTNKQQLPL
ncbi:ATP-dependent DNA ligase clustered with Ku protein, LigD [hydrothermal vent metagenome]|uniref:ATP-dependent DNA ligase clustered with Ku protein, LigD n=1 Tax=hydrothermal vent metagenome TaxID=652676 RepID=A0A3B0VDZ5_9ZZZZ